MNRILTLAAGALLASASPALQAQEAPENVTIGAASVGGTYYVWATGMASVLNNNMDVNANVEVTGGPLHNIQLGNAGELTFGLSTAAPAYEGYNGIEWSDGTEHTNIRAVVPMYPSYFHWWAPTENGISSVDDLEGKIVALGPKGGTPDTYGRRFLEFSGIEPARIVNSGFSDIVGQLRDGLVDAALTTAGLPHPAVMESDSTSDIEIFGISEERAAAFMEEYPYFATGVIPADVYQGLDEDLSTLTLWNFIITNKDVSDDFVYDVTKTMFEQQDAMIEAHRSSENMTVDNLDKITIPLHPGALRYYEEQGVEIPERLTATGAE